MCSKEGQKRRVDELVDRELEGAFASPMTGGGTGTLTHTLDLTSRWF